VLVSVVMLAQRTVESWSTLLTLAEGEVSDLSSQVSGDPNARPET